MAGITYEVDDKNIVEQIKSDAAKAASELVEAAHLKKSDIVVVGCSTSETLGNQVGSHSVPEVGKAIYEGIQRFRSSGHLYRSAMLRAPESSYHHRTRSRPERRNRECRAATQSRRFLCNSLLRIIQKPSSARTHQGKRGA